jgi:hypothetical protein
MDTKLVLDLFRAEHGRPITDTVELIRYVMDLRSRYAWKTLPEVIEQIRASLELRAN